MYQLDKSNFSLLDDTLVYEENVSKTNSGGIKDRNHKPKKVSVHRNPDLENHCVVMLFKLYMSRCDPTNHFIFAQPITNPRGVKWYSRQRVGVHKCENMLKSIAGRANLAGRITNHSMRKTTVTRLAKANVENTVIKAITGHRSDAGVEAYRVVDSDDISAASRTLGLP